MDLLITEIYMNFSVPIQKEVKKIDKNGEQVTKTIYRTYYNLSIAQDLW